MRMAVVAILCPKAADNENETKWHKEMPSGSCLIRHSWNSIARYLKKKKLSTPWVHSAPPNRRLA